MSVTTKPVPGPRLSPLGRALRAAGRLGFALIGALAGHAAVLAQQPSSQLEPVDVIGVSPLPGQEVDRSKLPYATQRPVLDLNDAQGMVNWLTAHGDRFDYRLETGV